MCYIMAGNDDDDDGSSMYYCIDEALEQLPSSGACETVHVLFTVSSTVPTNSGYELPCVVCTK